jgi:hypothetical protein
MVPLSKRRNLEQPIAVSNTPDIFLGSMTISTFTQHLLLILSLFSDSMIER